MLIRRDTLEQALADVEAHAMTGVSKVVVNRRWWDELSAHEQDAYRLRAERAAVELLADDSLSSHFVEVRGGDDGPPLSTERPM